MKSLKHIWLFCLTLATLGLVSCNDDDEASGSSPITVTQIYLEDADATVTDRPVDFVRLGQTIRIEGSGFKGLKELYINGYETYFNTAYVTNTNMIVTVSTDTPVSDAEAKPGDLVFFEYTYDGPWITHVGIYVGDGWMIHAGDPIGYIKFMDSYYSDNFVGFGRLPAV